MAEQTDAALRIVRSRLGTYITFLGMCRIESHAGQFDVSGAQYPPNPSRSVCTLETRDEPGLFICEFPVPGVTRETALSRLHLRLSEEYHFPYRRRLAPTDLRLARSNYHLHWESAFELEASDERQKPVRASMTALTDLRLGSFVRFEYDPEEVHPELKGVPRPGRRQWLDQHPEHHVHPGWQDARLPSTPVTFEHVIEWAIRFFDYERWSELIENAEFASVAESAICGFYWDSTGQRHPPA